MSKFKRFSWFLSLLVCHILSFSSFCSKQLPWLSALKTRPVGSRWAQRFQALYPKRDLSINK